MTQNGTRTILLEWDLRRGGDECVLCGCPPRRARQRTRAALQSSSSEEATRRGVRSLLRAIQDDALKRAPCVEEEVRLVMGCNGKRAASATIFPPEQRNRLPDALLNQAASFQ